MTGEDYVNKELMPLLLEKGCFLDKVFVQDFRPIWYTKDSNAPTWQDCDAYYIPTQSQVLKWLREVHNLHITIYSCSQESWMYRITKPHQKLEDGEYGEDFYSYENACDAAIKHCLENLI